jgi:ATP-dependent protease ClpP protease subunit
MVKSITIDGEIGKAEGQVSAQWFQSQMPVNSSEPIEIVIHSEGGNVWEGFKIYDLLTAYSGRKKAVIRSTAFSIASFIPMACDEIEIAPNGYFMLHKPSISTEGNEEELTAQAHLLKQTCDNMIAAYCKKTGRTEEQILEIVSRETFLNAQQSVELGFADRIVGEPYVGRQFSQAETMPHGVVVALFGAGPGGAKSDRPEEQPMSSQPVAATISEIKAAFPKAKAEFVLKCLEKEMPMSQVATEAATEAMTEMESLLARLKATEEENMQLKAQLAAKEEAPVPTAPAQEPTAK